MSGVQPATSRETLVSLQAKLQRPRHRCALCQAPALQAVPYNQELMKSVLKHMWQREKLKKKKKSQKYEKKPILSFKVRLKIHAEC